MRRGRDARFEHGEGAMKSEIALRPAAAKALGCACQAGTGTPFGPVASHLEFLGHPRPAVAELRQGAAIRY